MQEEIKTINYLGSKFRILHEIEDAINEMSTTGAICDLFAGSGTVSSYFGSKRKVVSVDIQEYSRVLCSAVLNKVNIDIESDTIVDNCKNSYIYQKLEDIYRELINYENECIDSAINGKPGELCDFLENVSVYALERNAKKFCLDSKLRLKLEKVIGETNRNDMKHNSIVTRYFGGIYFSFEQSIQIDAIMNWIIKNTIGKEKDKFVAAVISATSEIVNTIGKQFAQPINPRNTEGKIKKNIGIRIQKDRKLDFFSFFKKWIQVYEQMGSEENIIICADYKDALARLPDDVTVVYADPPYTRYHYSRYYHVLETICLYDEPEISNVKVGNDIKISRGMYRSERHQSPFCIRSKAKKAFEELIESIAKKNVKLVLSYSPYEKTSGSTPRLMEINEIVEIANRYYKNVSIKEINNIVHSKLNKVEKNYEIKCPAEVLIMCSWEEVNEGKFDN